MNGLLSVLLLTLAVASTLGAGLELEFERALEQKRLLVGVLLANVVLIPMLALFVLSALPLEDGARTALQLVAVAPGGASSPLLARRAGGNAEFVALGFAASALASTAMVAAYLWFLGVHPSEWLLVIVAGQLAPLAGGAWLRRSRPAFAEGLAAPVRKLGNGVLLVTIATLAIQRSEALMRLGPSVLAAIFLVVLVTLASGALAHRPERRAMMALTGVRNLTLVLAAVEATWPGAPAAMVVAAYGLVMYLATAATSFA